MKKLDKTMIFAILLLSCSVIIMGVALSVTFAKYSSGGGVVSNSANAAKWGIDISSGSDVSATYKTKNEDESVRVTVSSTSSNVLVPGTEGCLAWFHINGDPEVKFSVDFSGNIDIGRGFWSYEEVLAEQAEQCEEYIAGVKDEIKTSLGEEAFENLTEEQLQENINQNIDSKIKADLDDAGIAAFNALTEEQKAAKRHDFIIECVSGTDMAKNKKKLLLLDKNGNEVGYFPITIKLCVKDQKTNVKQTLKTFEEYDDMRELISDINIALDNDFNASFAPNQEIDKIYTVEWEWKYLPASETIDENGHYIENVDGVSTYQSSFLDTELSSKMAKSNNNGMFNISFDMNVTVSQVR